MSLNLSEQYDKIYKYCYFKTSNATLAEDLTQETFLRYFSQNTYINKGKQLAYLYTIARNLCIDSYKSLVTKELTEDYQDTHGIPDLEIKIAVKQALELLEVEEQEVLLLRYVNQVSVEEICVITGLSRFAVYRKKTGALKKLKSILREEDFYG